MAFSSLTFLCVFLPVVLLFNAVLGKRAQNGFLLLASLAFYAWGEPAFVLLLLASIAGNYGLALAIADCGARKMAARGKACLILAVTLNIGILFVFKYLDFAVENGNALLRLLSRDAERTFLRTREIALPIGISFYTFQALSYVMDVYRGESAQTNPIDLGLYIAFFPKLIMGPITRYPAFEKELHHRERSLDKTVLGMERFALGLSKKMLLANTVAAVADQVFPLATSGAISCGLAWFGALCYALQIYFDFSGYTDMAIGLGHMLGFTLPENFRYPYAAATVSDFWRRWHITLGAWFRDYVYIPMGGSRAGVLRLIRNLFVVWLLTGIWHGANWTFLAWGMLYFVLISAEKLLHIDEFLHRRRWAAIPYRAFTLLCVLLGWVLFRADGVLAAGRYVKSMFGLYGVVACAPMSLYYMQTYAGIAAVAALLSLPLAPHMAAWLQKRLPEKVCTLLRRVLLLLLFAVSVAMCVANTYNPFIYFQF